MTEIRLKGVGKDYGSTTAVGSIDLVIRSGALSFLLGPSGCGKTTLLRMIAGFIEPTRGRIFFGERDVTDLPPNRRNAGMVFQSYALWPHMSVLDNVAFGLDVRKVRGAERQARTMRALERVRMREYAQRRPNELSGGQQQRVALARALVIEPTVLLLDEPLSNLDAKLRLEMRSEIRRLCTELRITTVYVTHDQKEALSMADDMAVLRAGAIVQAGPPEALYRRPATEFVADFLGETNFVPGRVAAIEAGALLLETPIGLLRSERPAGGLGGGESSSGGAPVPRAPGEPVTISIRPEAIRLLGAESPPPAVGAGARCLVPGHCRETIYLGESAQHLIDAGGGLLLKVNEPNPRARVFGPCRLEIDPSDIVIVAGDRA